MAWPETRSAIVIFLGVEQALAGGFLPLSRLKEIFSGRLKFFAALMFHTRHASSPNATSNTIGALF